MNSHVGVLFFFHFPKNSKKKEHTRGGNNRKLCPMSKNSKGKKSGKAVGDAQLTNLVNMIESASDEHQKQFIEQAMKTGKTRSQAKAEYDKKMEEATAQMQSQLMQSVAGPTRQANPSAEQLRMAQAIRAAKEQAYRFEVAKTMYSKKEVALTAKHTEWVEVAPSKYIRFEQFDKSNEQMESVVSLYDKELSEPYSSFTYQFFIFGWPDLCILAFGATGDVKPEPGFKGEMIGAVVSRTSFKRNAGILRGYVAMLAVKPHFRGAKIGSRLVEVTVDLMTTKGCEEVSLETPVTNQRALKLYTDLGFAKVKFLPSYYLDGSDAFRLKLYLTDVGHHASQNEDDEPATQAEAVAAAQAEAGTPPALEPSP